MKLKFKSGRHAPSFVLLMLAEEPAYGGLLLEKFEKRVPYNRMDSAATYRVLKELEKCGAIESYWDTPLSGRPKKWYRITAYGWDLLEEFKEDIYQSLRGLEFFLEMYRDIKKERREP
ncbi:PadR family transcriptional regulator [Melghirimyces algeriensis]|uniref:DNA-binding transcriptional regulator, PadR family n=1 Tax=Melghirimyces algeriensis TaxID=910412 RepID=A0A521BGS5_9BACL|nr:PadR family transcriptional regulator [Melghirimyces algeriensis]SMO45920.1 DNA-binding transcriptional regulator, PadR family [Melghirimyces algeriensis]